MFILMLDLLLTPQLAWFFPRLLGWSCKLQKDSFRRCPSLTHGDVSLLKHVETSRPRRRPKMWLLSLHGQRLMLFSEDWNGWIDAGVFLKACMNLSGLWHMFGRMHHHAVCVGPPYDWGKHVITTFWSHINVCSFVWQVIILPWRAHQMKAIMWATLREFQGPSTMAV